MSCSFKWNDAGIAGAAPTAHKVRDPQLEAHVLFVEIPPRTARARRWALARGIGEIDIISLIKMVRAERLCAG